MRNRKKVTDLCLLKFFKKKILQLEFIRVYGDILYDINKNLNNLIKIENERKEDYKGKLPLSRQEEKVKSSQILWKLILKAAIFFLRDKDDRDTNKFKDDFGINEITNYFEEFSEFEYLIYGSDKFYREHSIHVIKVYLLGNYLLLKKDQKDSIDSNIISYENLKISGNTLIKVGNTSPESVYLIGKNNIPNKKEKFLLHISNEEKKAMWAIIALTHDLGYPIEKIDKINERMKNILQYYGSSNFQEFKYNLPLQYQFINDFILKFISSKLVKSNNNKKFHTVIQNKYYLKFSKSFEKFSHGIISCILLMKHLVYFLESDYSHFIQNPLDKTDASQFLIRREILRAIASHDNDDIYHVYPNNFLFLLRFCDDIQEWERTSRYTEKKYIKEVYIEEFSQNYISFSINYTPLDDKNIIDDLIDIFARRIKIFIKIFRSAVDSDKRTFEFKFKINSKINKNKKEENYFFEFIYPKEVSYPEINSYDKQYDLKYFLKYISDKKI